MSDPQPLRHLEVLTIQHLREYDYVMAYRTEGVVRTLAQCFGTAGMRLKALSRVGQHLEKWVVPVGESRPRGIFLYRPGKPANDGDGLAMTGDIAIQDDLVPVEILQSRPATSRITLFTRIEESPCRPN